MKITSQKCSKFCGKNTLENCAPTNTVHCVQYNVHSSTKSKPYSKKLYHELGELQWVKIMKEKTGGEGDRGAAVFGKTS